MDTKIRKAKLSISKSIASKLSACKSVRSDLSDLIESTHIHSLVVFTPKSEFKTALPQNVFQGKTWIEYVKSFQQPVIQPMRAKRIRFCLEKERLEPSRKTDREHIQQLQEEKQ